MFFCVSKQRYTNAFSLTRNVLIRKWMFPALVLSLSMCVFFAQCVLDTVYVFRNTIKYVKFVSARIIFFLNFFVFDDGF